MAKGKAVTVPRQTAVVDWNTSLKASAAKAKVAAAALGTASKFISFKGGALIVDGAPRAPSWMRCIVLSTMGERAYYEGPYQPDTMRSPLCYGYGEVDGGEVETAHASCQEEQSDTCHDCKWSQWKSASSGKGQACTQYLRIALIEVPEKSSAEDVGKAPIRLARIPPTSLKNAKAWLDYINVQNSVPYAWVTVLEAKPSPQSMLSVHLTPEAEIAPALRNAVLARLTQAQKDIAEEYPDMEEAKATAKTAAKPAAKRRF